MKLRLWSDLHFEFAGHKYDHIWTPSPDDKETIVLLAGDIDLGTCASTFVHDLCKDFKHVLYCHGNHEHYHRDYKNNIVEWMRIEEEGPENFHFLYNDWRILDGVRFLGGTMWTSFDNADILTMASARREMNDYQEIHCDGERITPHFILAEHNKFIEFLKEEFDKPFDGKTVVMTHHSPGSALKRNGRVNDRLDHCYYADLEQMIGNANVVDLWVHGHTHQSADYLINETRVVCNPYGYHNYATNPDFDKNLIIEL